MISACQVLWILKINEETRDKKSSKFSASTDVQFSSLQKCSVYKYYISEKFDTYRMTFVATFYLYVQYLVYMCTYVCVLWPQYVTEHL